MIERTLDQRVDDLERIVHEAEGVLKMLRIASMMIGIILGLYTFATVVGAI